SRLQEGGRRSEDGMRTSDEGYRRPIGAELEYICDRLQVEEGEILAKALRRGVLEIYKAVVLHELQSGRIDRTEASRRLGSRVVGRVLPGKPTSGGLRAQRPGGRKMPRRRK